MSLLRGASGSQEDQWRLSNAELLGQIAGAAWASGTESGADLYKLYSAGRIAYEVYQRLKQGGDLRKELLRAETVRKITEFVESNKRMPKDKLSAEVQMMIVQFAVQVATL
ncbi:uncharacterized protein LOC134179740 [Corticium candelabrum]|uniref:uncharacterized protein LOC134179740 n=1 Tax=Corticium candelabrum TaxID=121492 RepID=UPI002E2538DF|nr:uncharacterized protein LOC134179740 [Corticium candelabrum]